jgi:peptidyl-prolyl cis-trans isomerase A (cyclophilin A)
MKLTRSVIVLTMLAASIASSHAQSKGAIRAMLSTALGDITVEVFPNAAPLSACDFLAYVDAGLYRGAHFHRVVRNDNDRGSPKIEVVQGGLADEAKQRPPIAHETTRMTGLKHENGTLSLARAGVGTGGAGAFFIVIGTQPSLDFGGLRNKDGQGFAAFGRVIEGMDIVKRIHAMKGDAPTDDEYTRGQVLAKPILIRDAKRIDPLPPVCKQK